MAEALTLRFSSETITSVTRLAIPTKQFRSPMMTETFCHSLSTWRVKNLIKRLGKEISKRDIAIMIHTARHQTSIRKNTYLFAESLAEYLSPLPTPPRGRVP